MPIIAFSLLVHESSLCILDEVKNILLYNPNSLVVLHFNPKFRNNEELGKDKLISLLSKDKRVIVNPHPVSVSLDNIIQGHISNYECIAQMDFKYFYLISSHELFVHSGAEEFVQQYDYGCRKRKDDHWVYFDKMCQDEALERIINASPKENYILSQVEGSFYSKPIFDEMYKKIKDSFNPDKQNVVYPREEIFFPTIACNDFTYKNRYDGCLCYINWKKGLFISLKEIKKTITSDSLFSVKRINRSYQDYLRQYIRNYLVTNNNNILQEWNDALPKEKPSKAIIYFKNIYWCTFFCIRSFLADIKHCITKKH